MISNRIDIGKDFSRIPRGRYHPDDGPNTGERFREEFLKKIFDQSGEYSQPVEIVLDSAEGYGSSFLEEAFGGLVRKGYATSEEANKTFVFVYENKDFEYYAIKIKEYIKEAIFAQKN